MLWFKKMKESRLGPRDIAFRLEALDLIFDLQILRDKSQLISDASLDLLRSKLAQFHSEVQNLRQFEGIQ